MPSHPLALGGGRLQELLALPRWWVQAMRCCPSPAVDLVWDYAGLAALPPAPDALLATCSCGAAAPALAPAGG